MLTKAHRVQHVDILWDMSKLQSSRSNHHVNNTIEMDTTSPRSYASLGILCIQSPSITGLLHYRDHETPLCNFYFRSRGQQVHFVWGAPVAQRLLQLQKVLRVSGGSGFPDIQRWRLLPWLRQRPLSDLQQLERVCLGWLPVRSLGCILLMWPLLHYLYHLSVSYTLTCMHW